MTTNSTPTELQPTEEVVDQPTPDSEVEIPAAVDLYRIRQIISYDLIRSEQSLAQETAGLDFDLEDYKPALNKVKGADEYFDDYIGSSVLAMHSDYEELDKDLWAEVGELVDGETVVRPYQLTHNYIIETDLPDVTVETLNPNSGATVTKEWKQHRTDIPSLAKTDFSTVNRELTVDFPAIFSRPIPEYLTKYDISQKSYVGILDKIENDVNFVLNEYPEVATKLLAIRVRSIEEGVAYTTEDYLKDIINLISDIKLRSVVYGIIDSTYTISLDKASEESNRRIIEDLQLTDRANKCLLAIALLARFTVPITSQYCRDYGKITDISKKEEKDLFSRLCLVIFEYLVKFISYENGVNLINKLYKIIEPRVKGTNYSNKVIWRFLLKHTMDDDTAVYKYINTIIRTILPKLNPNSSTISFLDVVVKRMLECDFKVNYSLTFKTFSITSGGSDEDTNEIDIVSANKFMKTNELTEVANELTIAGLIKTEFQKYGITQEQVDYIHDNISHLNELQVRLLEMFYYGKIEITKFPRRTIAKLLLIMYYRAKAENLIYLPDLILAQVDADSANRKRGNSRIYGEILNSKSYQQIRNSFTIAQDKFDRGGHLLKLSTVYVYDFISFDPTTFQSKKIVDIDRNILHNDVFNFKLML